MPDYKHLELSALIDMLSEYTATYTKMLTEGNTSEEFKSYKKISDYFNLKSNPGN